MVSADPRRGVVLADFAMPGMSGADLSEALHAPVSASIGIG
jgi:FixJ family two-component response regulator